MIKKILHNTKGEIATAAVLIGMLLLSLGVVAGGNIINKQRTQTSSQASGSGSIDVMNTVLPGNLITNNGVAPFLTCAKGQWCMWGNGNGLASVSTTSTAQSAGKLQLKATNMAAGTGVCWIQQLNVTQVSNKRYKIRADIDRPAALTGGQFFMATEIKGNANYNVKPITGSGILSYAVDIPANVSSNFVSFKFCLWEAKFAQPTTVTLKNLAVYQVNLPTPTLTPTHSPTPIAVPSQNISIKANSELSKITGNKVELVYDISTPQTNTEAAWAFTFQNTVPALITNVSWTCQVLKPGKATGGMSTSATRCSSKSSGTGSNTVTFGHTSLADPLIHPGGAIQVIIKGVISAAPGTQVKNTAAIKSYSGWKAGHFFTNKREHYSTYPDANLNDNEANIQLTVPASVCIPTLSAPANNASLSSAPTFQWSACPGTNNKYQIIVTKGGVTFQNVITNTTSYTFPLTQWPNATYSWTVKYCTNPDCVGGTPSAARTFTYAGTSSCVAPTTPTGLQPNTDRVANPPTGKVVVKWNAVVGADTYALRIDNKQNGWVENCTPTNAGDVCINQSGTQYEYAVEPGQIYNVWVRAMKNCGGTFKYSEAVSQQFQIYIPTSPTANLTQPPQTMPLWSEVYTSGIIPTPGTNPKDTWQSVEHKCTFNNESYPYAPGLAVTVNNQDYAYDNCNTVIPKRPFAIKNNILTSNTFTASLKAIPTGYVCDRWEFRLTSGTTDELITSANNSCSVPAQPVSYHANHSYFVKFFLKPESTTPTSEPSTTHPYCYMKPQGDANCDDVINSLDYACWKAKYIDGQTLENCKYTDFDDAGGTEILDFTILKANFSLE